MNDWLAHLELWAIVALMAGLLAVIVGAVFWTSLAWTGLATMTASMVMLLTALAAAVAEDGL